MFRPNRLVHKLTLEPSCAYATLIQAPSIASRAERLKIYSKYTRAMLGPLLESKKQKEKKEKSAQNSARSSPSDVAASATFGSFLKNRNADTVVVSQGNKMWSKAPPGLALKLTSRVSGLKTVSRHHAAQTASTVDSLPPEDKILQIRQHRNDYSREYPSVTLILNRTMTDDQRAALDKWKREKIAEMGQEAFDKYYEAQMALGTKFHSTLRRYFLEPKSKLGIEADVEPVWTSVQHLLPSISAPRAIESNVVHPVLKYRGVFDAIADYQERPTLIEWKKSEKQRKAISVTYDNPVQLAAYFGAVCNDLNYKHLKVRDALLVIAYTDGSKADHFHLPVDKLREHWAHWLVRLEAYTKKHGQDMEKVLKGGKRLFEEDAASLK